MECTILEKYLKDNDCTGTVVPIAMEKHLGECNDCRKYYQFVVALDVQKGSLEKAPEDILPTIEKRIAESIKPVKSRDPFAIFKPLFKPALAGFFAVLVAVMFFTYLANKNIGHVENLSKRFNIAEFENIKSGDVLYTGDNTTAAINLKNKNTLQIHHNTIVRVKGSRQIALSRGEISLLSGDKALQVETPDGLLLARNANTKITTIARLEKGVLKTETTCIVFNGTLIITSHSKETTLHQGQKAILAENSGITYQQQLTAADFESEKGTAVKQKIFEAVESLCDCIHEFNYTPGKKGNHRELFGKEVNENKFKVRVFWKEKGLNELVFGPLNENNKLCPTKIRRINVS
jgi:hypothetical protein